MVSLMKINFDKLSYVSGYLACNMCLWYCYWTQSHAALEEERQEGELLDPIQNSLCIGVEVNPMSESFSHIEE